MGRSGAVAALSARRDSDPALQSALERLAEADLLFVEGAPPYASYRFKHALIRDAAYESLLKSRRQALHRRAAEALCNLKVRRFGLARRIAQRKVAQNIRTRTARLLAGAVRTLRRTQGLDDRWQTTS
jgi:hypothetical protein